MIPRLFRLVRDVDVTGVSGTGVVAWGVVFGDGKAVTRWDGTATGIAQTCVWDSIEDVRAIHGHGGATRVEWLDQPEPSPSATTPTGPECPTGGSSPGSSCPPSGSLSASSA